MAKILVQDLRDSDHYSQPFYQVGDTRSDWWTELPEQVWIDDLYPAVGYPSPIVINSYIGSLFSLAMGEVANGFASSKVSSTKPTGSEFLSDLWGQTPPAEWDVEWKNPYVVPEAAQVGYYTLGDTAVKLTYEPLIETITTTERVNVGSSRRPVWQDRVVEKQVQTGVTLYDLDFALSEDGSGGWDTTRTRDVVADRWVFADGLSITDNWSSITGALTGVQFVESEFRWNTSSATNVPLENSRAEFQEILFNVDLELLKDSSGVWQGPASSNTLLISDLDSGTVREIYDPFTGANEWLGEYRTEWLFSDTNPDWANASTPRFDHFFSADFVTKTAFIAKDNSLSPLDTSGPLPNEGTSLWMVSGDDEIWVEGPTMEPKPWWPESDYATPGTWEQYYFIHAGTGEDTVYGSQAREIIDGGTGSDILYGNWSQSAEGPVNGAPDIFIVNETDRVFSTSYFAQAQISSGSESNRDLNASSLTPFRFFEIAPWDLSVAVFDATGTGSDSYTLNEGAGIDLLIATGKMSGAYEHAGSQFPGHFLMQESPRIRLTSQDQVDLAQDVIVKDDHGFETGYFVRYQPDDMGPSDLVPIGGLRDWETYYVEKVSDSAFRLYSTTLDGQQGFLIGDQVDFTSYANEFTAHEFVQQYFNDYGNGWVAFHDLRWSGENGMQIASEWAKDRYLSDNLDLTGNDQTQIILGNDGVNRLSGLGGDDELWGLEGDDLIDGGEGNDLILSGAGNDTVFGGSGEDVMWANLGSIRTQNLHGFDVQLSATGGDDYFNGGGGDDTLFVALRYKTNELTGDFLRGDNGQFIALETMQVNGFDISIRLTDEGLSYYKELEDRYRETPELLDLLHQTWAVEIQTDDQGNEVGIVQESVRLSQVEKVQAVAVGLDFAVENMPEIGSIPWVIQSEVATQTSEERSEVWGYNGVEFFLPWSWGYEASTLEYLVLEDQDGVQRSLVDDGWLELRPTESTWPFSQLPFERDTFVVGMENWDTGESVFLKPPLSSKQISIPEIIGATNVGSDNYSFRTWEGPFVYVLEDIPQALSDYYANSSFVTPIAGSFEDDVFALIPFETSVLTRDPQSGNIYGEPSGELLGFELQQRGGESYFFALASNLDDSTYSLYQVLDDTGITSDFDFSQWSFDGVNFYRSSYDFVQVHDLYYTGNLPHTLRLVESSLALDDLEVYAKPFFASSINSNLTNVNDVPHLIDYTSYRVGDVTYSSYEDLYEPSLVIEYTPSLGDAYYGFNFDWLGGDNLYSDGEGSMVKSHRDPSVPIEITWRVDEDLTQSASFDSYYSKTADGSSIRFYIPESQIISNPDLSGLNVFDVAPVAIDFGLNLLAHRNVYPYEFSLEFIDSTGEKILEAGEPLTLVVNPMLDLERGEFFWGDWWKTHYRNNDPNHASVVDFLESHRSVEAVFSLQIAASAPEDRDYDQYAIPESFPFVSGETYRIVLVEDFGQDLLGIVSESTRLPNSAISSAWEVKAFDVGFVYPDGGGSVRLDWERDVGFGIPISLNYFPEYAVNKGELPFVILDRNADITYTYQLQSEYIEGSLGDPGFYQAVIAVYPELDVDSIAFDQSLISLPGTVNASSISLSNAFKFFIEDPDFSSDDLSKPWAEGFQFGLEAIQSNGEIFFALTDEDGLKVQLKRPDISWGFVSTLDAPSSVEASIDYGLEGSGWGGWSYYTPDEGLAFSLNTHSVDVQFHGFEGRNGSYTYSGDDYRAFSRDFATSDEALGVQNSLTDAGYYSEYSELASSDQSSKFRLSVFVDHFEAASYTESLWFRGVSSEVLALLKQTGFVSAAGIYASPVLDREFSVLDFQANPLEASIKAPTFFAESYDLSEFIEIYSWLDFRSEFSGDLFISFDELSETYLGDMPLVLNGLNMDSAMLIDSPIVFEFYSGTSSGDVIRIDEMVFKGETSEGGVSEGGNVDYGISLGTDGVEDKGPYGEPNFITVAAEELVRVETARAKAGAGALEPWYLDGDTGNDLYEINLIQDRPEYAGVRIELSDAGGIDTLNVLFNNQAVLPTWSSDLAKLEVGVVSSSTADSGYDAGTGPQPPVVPSLAGQTLSIESGAIEKLLLDSASIAQVDEDGLDTTFGTGREYWIGSVEEDDETDAVIGVGGAGDDVLLQVAGREVHQFGGAGDDLIYVNASQGSSASGGEGFNTLVLMPTTVASSSPSTDGDSAIHVPTQSAWLSYEDAKEGAYAEVYLAAGIGILYETDASGEDQLLGVDMLESQVLGQGWANVVGTSGDDLLNGDKGANQLVGGAGDDRLYGGLTLIEDASVGEVIDVLSGGQGNDRFIVSSNSKAMTVIEEASDLSGGTDDRVLIDLSASKIDQLVSSWEGGTVLGIKAVGNTDNADTEDDEVVTNLFKVENRFSVERIGFSEDLFSASEPQVEYHRLAYGAGSSQSEIILTGKSGNAFFVGGGGQDIMLDASFDDIYVGGSSTDLMYALMGRDRVIAGGGDDDIYVGLGTKNRDIVLTGQGKDTVHVQLSEENAASPMLTWAADTTAEQRYLDIAEQALALDKVSKVFDFKTDSDRIEIHFDGEHPIVDIHADTSTGIISVRDADSNIYSVVQITSMIGVADPTAFLNQVHIEGFTQDTTLTQFVNQSEQWG